MHWNPRTTTLPATGAALVSLVAACAPTSAAPPADVTPITDSLTFDYRPGTWSYRSSSHRIVEREIGGRTRIDTILLEYRLTAEIAREDSVLAVHFVIDTVLHATARNVLPRELDRVGGARFTARMHPSGRLEGLDDSHPGSPLLAELARQISSFFPLVPPGGASPRSTWVDTAETQQHQAGAVLTVRSVTSYRSGEWARVEGEYVLAVEWQRQYQVEGGGEQFGQAFTVHGAGTASGRTRLSADGAYLGTVRQDELRAALTNDVQGIVTPVRQHQTDTTRVLR